MHAVVRRQHREASTWDRAQAARGVVERVVEHPPTNPIGDARGVQQIVDETDQVTDLTLHDFARPLARCVSAFR